MKPVGNYRNLETLSTLALAFVCAGVAFRSQLCLYAAIVLLTVGLFLKSAAGRVAGGWLGLARLLGALNTKILLALLFYCALTPIALIYRFLHKDSLNLGRDETLSTMWHDCTGESAEVDFEKMW